jgi:threonylcarbamoyladenosine tRNA methylthiotransferase MtaB
MKKTKKQPAFCIHTLGCKVNQYESQLLRENFLQKGMRETADLSRAQTLIVNTCTVTQHAERQSRQRIYFCLRENPKAKVIVLGCAAKNQQKKLTALNPRLSIITDKKKWPLEGISFFKEHTRAFVKIQDGCNQFCAYCIVPYVRGRSFSRPKKAILSELRCLIDHGYKEIVLSGICLGDYHCGRDDLLSLLQSIEKIEGNFRLRLSSVEFHQIRPELLEHILYARKICPHLHLPLQSADDATLKEMRRPYSFKDYFKFVSQARKIRPDVAISTDMLLGFPTESEQRFKNCLKNFQLLKPSRTHIFCYSARPGTAAAKMANLNRPQVVKARFQLLKIIADQCALDYAKSFRNKTVEVLCEKYIKNYPYLCGYSQHYLKVFFKADDSLNNQLLPVKIKQVKTNSIEGILDCKSH